MAGAEADQVVMLLSADWFAPHWRAMELRVSAEYQSALQTECRREVERFLNGGETYWRVSFAPDRVRGTRSVLASALGRFAPGSDFNKAVTNLILYGQERHDAASHEASTLRMLNMELMDPGGERAGGRGLHPETVDKLRDILGEIGANYVNYDELSLESVTAWDIHLRALTPERPTLLAGFLSDEIATRVDALTFLRRVRTRLLPDEIPILMDWYRAAAPRVVKEPFAVPHWMSEIVGLGGR